MKPNESTYLVQVRATIAIPASSIEEAKERAAALVGPLEIFAGVVSVSPPHLIDSFEKAS